MPAPARSAAHDVRTAVRATGAAFVATGLTISTWASRIPDVRDRLGLSPAGLGLLLLVISAGSVTTLVASGSVITRLGPRRTLAGAGLVFGAGLALAGIGVAVGAPVVVAGLLVLGLGFGGCNVAINVHGADVEHRRGRSTMPRFHAGFSLGTVCGALLGTAMVALGVPVAIHLVAVAALVATAFPYLSRRFLDAPAAGRAGPVVVEPVGADAAPSAARIPGGDPADRLSPPPGALRRWAEPRTLLIGACVLAFTVAEGAGNDWVGVALIDGHGASAAVGTLGLAAFLAAMTAVRWFVTPALDRFGRVAVVRVLGGVSLAGVALFVLAPSTPLAFAGALLWGAGVSVGFPVGMSAAADDPAAAAGRVSVVSSIGYVAFLTGPPLIGFLGAQVGTLHALVAVAAALVVAVTVAGTLAPLRTGAARSA